MTLKVARLLSLLLLLLVFPAGAAERIPVIIDTDIGDDIDDTWALVLALRSPELDIKLVVGDYGKPEYRARLIARLLETAGRTDIPVGLGIEHGKGQQERQQKWVADYNQENYPGQVYRDGVGAMINLIMDSPQPITVIGIGPTPNIAEALRRHPALAKKARFVGMYGSVRIGYGRASTPSPEWNVKADIASCQEVFSAPWEMTITPLDTCGLVQLDGVRYAKVFDSADPLARVIMTNYKIWEEFNASRPGTPNGYAFKHSTESTTLYDCVAVYLAITHEMCRMETLNLVVDDQGFTREQPDGKPVQTALEWKNLEGFKDWLVARLTGGGSRTAAPKIGEMIQPVPATAKFSDPRFHIWCGSMVEAEDGKHHLFYSRWSVEQGFHAGGHS